MNSIVWIIGKYFSFNRVFSAFVKEVDGKTNTDTIWGKKSSFGTCLSEFSNGRGNSTPL